MFEDKVTPREQELETAIEEVVKRCRTYIQAGIDGVETARQLGNEPRALAFENRTAVIQSILDILEKYDIPVKEK